MRLKEICDYISRGTTPDYVDESPYKVMNQALLAKVGLMKIMYVIPQRMFVRHRLKREICLWHQPAVVS